MSAVPQQLKPWDMLQGLFHILYPSMENNRHYKKKRNTYLFEWCNTPRIILLLRFTTDNQAPCWIWLNPNLILQNNKFINVSTWHHQHRCWCLQFEWKSDILTRKQWVESKPISISWSHHKNYPFTSNLADTFLYLWNWVYWEVEIFINSGAT